MLKDEKTKMPKDHTMRRILGYVLSHYKIPFIVVVVCIIITALVSSMSSIVITTLTNNYIVPAIEGRGTWTDCRLPHRRVGDVHVRGLHERDL